MRRCFKHEYIIKSRFIFCGFILLVYLVFFQSLPPLLVLFFLLAFPVLIFYYIRITNQRCHDLGLSFPSWFSLIYYPPPITNEHTKIGLYTKEGERGINKYDLPIKYRRLFNHRHCIDLHEKMFRIDNIEYHYERHLNKYSIKILSYARRNIFTEYLLNNYQVKEERIHRTGTANISIEITDDEFNDFINKMNLIVIINSFYLKIKECQIFIRKEDFEYSIILDKYINNIEKDMLHTYNFPGLLIEYEKYIYYRVSKKDLLMWGKNLS